MSETVITEADIIAAEEAKRQPAVGRKPMPFDPVRAAEFLERLERGEAIESICADKHMMSWPTVCRWKREFSGFAADYARTREASAESFEHLALAAARNATPEDFQANRLLVDTLKWAAAKRHPKVYGDKVEVGVTFTNGLADRLNAAMQRSGRVVDVEPEAIAGPDDETAKTD
jgi:Bacteriophage Sf6, terminase small subunit-like